MKCKKGEEKVSRKQPRALQKDEERGHEPWGASSPTTIMEEMCQLVSMWLKVVVQEQRNG